jgi:glycosyltransferase involved in cell wall biosynthesis
MGEVQHRPFSKILILSQYYAPEPGAPQIRLGAMARELKRLGVDVRVLTGMPNYPFGRVLDSHRGRLHMRETVAGIPVERVWLYPAAGRGSLKRLLSYLSFTLCVLPFLLCGERVDVVFVEAQPLTLALPAWLLKLFRGVPYVYNTPDLQCEIAVEQKWIGTAWPIRLAKALEAFLMRQALSVTTVTHAFIRHFSEQRNVPLETISFLPNGADIETLRPMPFDHAYAERLGTGQRKVFTYAGTHAHYQGLEVIVEAAKLLRDCRDIVIVMVGQGPVREELIRQATAARLDNLLFRDSPFEEMARLMSVTYASLVILRDMPAARKMRLSKTIPPLACGVPIIYCGHGESALIAEKEQCAVLVEPERPDRLAAAIRDLAARPGRRNEMGRQGRSLAEREFSWRRIVQDWVRQISCIQKGQDPRVPSLMI